MFNKSLDKTTLPAGLRKIIFGEEFNQSLDNTTLPAKLEDLTFGVLVDDPDRRSDFDQSLDKTTPSSSLQSFKVALFAMQQSPRAKCFVPGKLLAMYWQLTIYLGSTDPADQSQN